MVRQCLLKKQTTPGVHDTRVTNRDTLARVRPNKREVVLVAVVSTSFDRSMILFACSTSDKVILVSNNASDRLSRKRKSFPQKEFACC